MARNMHAYQYRQSKVHYIVYILVDVIIIICTDLEVVNKPAADDDGETRRLVLSAESVKKNVLYHTANNEQ